MTPTNAISAAIILAAMTPGNAADAAIRCQDAPGRPQHGVYWSWREIEGKRCSGSRGRGKPDTSKTPGAFTFRTLVAISFPTERPRERNLELCGNFATVCNFCPLATAVDKFHASLVTNSGVVRGGLATTVGLSCFLRTKSGPETSLSLPML